MIGPEDLADRTEGTVTTEEQARREKAPGENVAPLHVYGQLTPEQVAALPWRTVDLPDDVNTLSAEADSFWSKI